MRKGPNPMCGRERDFGLVEGVHDLVNQSSDVFPKCIWNMAAKS